MRYSVRMLAIIVLMLNSSCAALLYAPKTLQDSSGNTIGGPFDTWEELLAARRGLMYDQLLEWREELAEAEAELELELAESSGVGVGVYRDGNDLTVGPRRSCV